MHLDLMAAQARRHRVGLVRNPDRAPLAHLVDIGSLPAKAAQCVVGLAKRRGREQLLPIAITGKGSRLANQRPDDVPVIYSMLATASQTGHPLDAFALDAQVGNFRRHEVRDRHEAHRFYERCGFQATGVRFVKPMQAAG